MDVLLVGRRSDLGYKVSLILGGVAFPLKEEVHSLEVLLDPSLLLGKWVASVTRHTFYQLQLLSHLWPFLGKKVDLATEVLVLVRVKFLQHTLYGLPLIQNAAAKMQTEVGHRSHITPVLAHLHWLHTCFQAQVLLIFKDLWLTWVLFNEPTRPLWSSLEMLLEVPSKIRQVAT